MADDTFETTFETTFDPIPPQIRFSMPCCG
jgi:hypothetical protein